jgi:hypothetical protein
MQELNGQQQRETPAGHPGKHGRQVPAAGHRSGKEGQRGRQQQGIEREADDRVEVASWRRGGAQ